MQLFNSLMNPVICFIVCKSARDDIKQLLRCVAHKIRCTCRRPRLAASRKDENPDNFALEQIVSTNAGTSEQVVSGNSVTEAVSVNACTVEVEEVSVNVCTVGEEVAVNVGTIEVVSANTSTVGKDKYVMVGTVGEDMFISAGTVGEKLYVNAGTIEQNVSASTEPRRA